MEAITTSKTYGTSLKGYERSSIVLNSIQLLLRHVLRTTEIKPDQISYFLSTISTIIHISTFR